MSEYVRLHDVPHHQEDCSECHARTTILRTRIAEMLMRKEGILTRDTTLTDLFLYMQRNQIDEKAYCNKCLLEKSKS